MKTIQQLAQEAIEVQDACNLSGVVHAWSRSMTRLCELLPDLGTAGRNQHPINVLFSSKVASLTRSEDSDTFSKAYDACRQLAEQ